MLQVAISDAQSATPVLRSVTIVVPQARALGTLKYLATGTYPFVGVAQAEGGLFDGGTGMTLEAWVDTRVGGGNVSTAVQWQWRMSRTSRTNGRANRRWTRLLDVGRGEGRRLIR